MNDIFYSLTSNPILIFVFGFLIFFLFGMFRKRKNSELVKQQQANQRNEAAAKGMQVTSQRASEVVVRTDGAVEAAGETEYSGTTGGIVWKLVSEVRATSRDVDDRPGRQNTDVWKRSTRLKTESVKFPAGKFLLLMSTPGYDSASKPIKRSGFLNKLVNMAADVALDFYVGGYFGSQYKSLVGIGNDSEKIERTLLNDFMILTNHKNLGERFLDEATTTVIANWKKQNQGFTREGSVDQFGLLFAPDAMVLGCQADMANADEVKTLSDFACVLAVRMNDVLHAS